MSDFSELMEYVKNILPTVALRIATATTLGIAISIAALPGYLKEVWPELHIPEILLFQLALISTTLFVGSFVLIVLLLKYINQLKAIPSLNVSKEQKYRLHEFQTGTKAFVFDEPQQNYASHYFCENCMNKGHISSMQPTGFHNGKAFFLNCHTCKLLIPILSMSNALERHIRAKIKA